MAKAVVVVKTVIDENPATTEDKLLTDVGNYHASLHQRLGEMYNKVAGGVIPGRSVVRIDSDTATTAGNELLSSTINATFNTALTGDIMTIGNVTLTVAVSPANEAQVAYAATNASTIANWKTKINAHSMLGGIIKADTSGTDVVTLQYIGVDRTAALLQLSSSATITLSATQFVDANTTLAKQTGTTSWGGTL